MKEIMNDLGRLGWCGSTGTRPTMTRFARGRYKENRDGK